MAEKLDLTGVEAHVAFLRHKAESDQMAADELDIDQYDADDPADIQAGLEFAAETATKSANVIESLIARIRELESASQPGGAWQPIETAPKDVKVWAFNGEHGVMEWSEGDGWALWIWSDETLADIDPEPDQPTHWMPLPSAPSAGNGGAEGE